MSLNIDIDNTNINIPEIIKEMKNSPFNFYLTGKKYWDDPLNEEWEFFTEVSSNTSDWLLERGFKKYYLNNDSIAFLYNNEGKIILVWAVKSAHFKVGIQEFIYNVRSDGTEEEAKKLWFKMLLYI